MSDQEKIKRLKRILSPVIHWYEEVKSTDIDSIYLYDTTVDMFNDKLSRAEFQQIIEILLEKPND